jgi:Ca-activated chloride channel homolog
MIAANALRAIRFGEPQFLQLLAIPTVLVIGWIRQLVIRRRDLRRFAVHRRVPVRERASFSGGLMFWLCLIAAIACVILALARPRSLIAQVGMAGADVVILQDGSASMRVQDVAGDRWQRSMDFVRVLGDSLSWKEDRIAMALFAHIAVPQLRLTRDPNTLFFFLDHLAKQPPFRLEDDTTWDTNIELGVYWGLRLIQKDRDIHGQSPNAPVFVLISDGEAWSGEVEKSLIAARLQGAPVFVVGVGTTSGGMIPPVAAPRLGQKSEPPVHAALDRPALLAIAAAGGGQYFELNREGDREIADHIIGATRRRGAANRAPEEKTEELYRRFLVAAACLIITGILFTRERMELWIHVAAAVAALLIVFVVF